MFNFAMFRNLMVNVSKDNLSKISGIIMYRTVTVAAAKKAPLR